MSLVFNDTENPVDKEELIQLLCDCSSLLCDLMFQLSRTRRSHIYPCVDRKKKPILEEAVTDEFFFGADFGKRIKAASAAEKVEISIKSTSRSNDSSRSKQFLNWKSPSASRNLSTQAGYKRNFTPRTFYHQKESQLPPTIWTRGQTQATTLINKVPLPK